jgi:hypothetical protein
MNRAIATSVTSILSAIALGGLLTVPARSEAGGMSHGVMLVSASVRPSAMFRFSANSSIIAISAADIERGYVDIPAASLLSVSAGKVPPVVVVEFAPQVSAIKSVEVKTERGWRVAAGGATADLLWQYFDSLPATASSRPSALGPRLDALSLTATAESPGDNRLTEFTYRFNLSDKARPGNYAVPLTLNITL